MEAIYKMFLQSIIISGFVFIMMMVIEYINVQSKGLWQKHLTGNKFKDFDQEQEQEQEHGSQKKGVAIIDFSQSLNVNVLVSKRFGKNVQMVNLYFIPVIVPEDTPVQVLEILAKHMKWIEDELKNKSGGFNLFTISKGILKTRIKKAE